MVSGMKPTQAVATNSNTCTINYLGCYNVTDVRTSTNGTTTVALYNIHPN